ncbi:DoxX family protein [Paenibacillus sp. GYB003]|uniref:DoxX family protein n=1 Tax=Paenibacillus sp. GYB003 TaxID=2994392 RepID=UPI002F96298A
MGNTNSKGRLWTGRIMSGIVILFMLFDGISKLFKPAVVVEGTTTLGFAEHHIVLIGILALIPTILYAIPRTSILGAVLLTGFYGGVIATHVRMDAPLFTHTLFPVYLAILAWVGLWLRNEKARSFLS